MIKTVIFDIGNVLMKFEWIPYITSMFDHETARIVSEAIWKDGLWNEFDRGVLTEEEIRSRMVGRAPEYERQIHMALNHVNQCMHKCEYAIPWIQELKDLGYQVLFLSNYSEFLQKANPKVLDFIPYVDGGVFSCDVKVIKPNQAIYEKICEKYQLKPEECLFIDDNKDNIEAAKDYGINVFLFKDYGTDYEPIMEYLKTINTM